MGKIRKGRLVAAACVFGVVTWGVVTQRAGDPKALATEPAAETTKAPDDDGPRTRTLGAATAWANNTGQLASLVEGFPQVTVHRLRSYAAGTLRLECTMSGHNIKDVALFRHAAKGHDIADDSTVKLSEVQFQAHGTCDVHGEPSKIMAFYLDISPTESFVGAAIPGMLQLVPRCVTK